MSKKYDNNLQEIKETGTFATNTTIDSRNLGTLGVYFERDVLTKKVAELKHQLAEKDKEIERLTNYLTLEQCLIPARCEGKPMTKLQFIQKFIDENRHQFCKEARDKAGFLYHYLNVYGEREAVLTKTEFEDILLRLEKGE